MVVCKCSFLDGKEVDITVNRDALGQDLLDSVCKYLNVQDATPFGLIHKGGSKPSIYNWWVRLDKPLRKQIKGKCQVWAFALVLKFYPRGSMHGLEDLTRYYSVLQVRDDLLTRRLLVSTNTLAILASYWLQSEYGEYTSDSVDRQLAEGFRFVRSGTRSKKGKKEEESDIDFEEQMIELHRFLKDMPTAKADAKFLKLASSLPAYGTHYYAAFELPNSITGRGRFGSRIQECGDSVTFGVGCDGLSKKKEKMKEPTTYPWTIIQSIAFKQNSITIKLHSSTSKKEQQHVSFVFEDMNQAKIVWRIAVDFHVHYRVDHRQPEPQSYSVKLKRKWSLLGKKEAKIVKTTTPSHTPSFRRRPQLAAIAEHSPASIRKSQMSLHRDDETTPKEIEASQRSHNRFPALPLKAPKSPSTRSHSSRKPSSPPAEKRKPPTASPKSVTKQKKNHTKPNSHSSSPKFSHKARIVPPPPTAGHDEKILSAVPARLKTGYARSQTSTAGEEVLSEVSDNTDVLCSHNIIEKAFSYAEDDGINSIHSWLELCNSRGNEGRGRPVSRSAPASQRSRSRGRSPPLDLEANDIDDYKPLIKSKHPIVIKAKDLRDLSPPLTVHYKDEPIRRKPERYQSEDNVARKDWTIRREPLHAFDPAARRFADVYRQEYLHNVADHPTDRRARSMYSLGPRKGSRDRSPVLACRSTSPSTVSAHASSGSRRSCDSYLGTTYDDDFHARFCDLPVESNFTRRVLSESKLARERAVGGRPYSVVARQRDIPARQRRRNVTSWALGDRDDTFLREQYGESEVNSTAKRSRMHKEDFSGLPRFVRSVR